MLQVNLLTFVCILPMQVLLQAMQAAFFDHLTLTLILLQPLKFPSLRVVVSMHTVLQTGQWQYHKLSRLIHTYDPEENIYRMAIGCSVW
jgi:hypothetical protein